MVSISCGARLSLAEVPDHGVGAPRGAVGHSLLKKLFLGLHFGEGLLRTRQADLTAVGLRGVGGLGLVLGEDGLAVVLDVSDVAVVVVGGVGDGLDTAVGEVDLVGAGHGLAIGGLLGVEVGAGVVVLDGVGVSVGLGGLLVVGGGSGGDGEGRGHEGGGGDEDLEHVGGCVVLVVLCENDAFWGGLWGLIYSELKHQQHPFRTCIDVINARVRVYARNASGCVSSTAKYALLLFHGLMRASKLLEPRLVRLKLLFFLALEHFGFAHVRRF